jgi:hypothetical protein
MQKNEKELDNRLGAERGQELDTCKAACYEKRYGELARRLTVDAVLMVVLPWGEQSVDLHGIWDTGATDTVVNRPLLEKAGIVTFYKDDDEPMTLTQVGHAGLVNGRLRIGDVVTPIFPVKVTDFDPDGRLAAMGREVPDVLIGMDVIASGRFEVNSIGNETVLTFEPEF